MNFFNAMAPMMKKAMQQRQPVPATMQPMTGGPMAGMIQKALPPNASPGPAQVTGGPMPAGGPMAGLMRSVMQQRAMQPSAAPGGGGPMASMLQQAMAQRQGIQPQFGSGIARLFANRPTQPNAMNAPFGGGMRMFPRRMY